MEESTGYETKEASVGAEHILSKICSVSSEPANNILKKKQINCEHQEFILFHFNMKVSLKIHFFKLAIFPKLLVSWETSILEPAPELRVK